jgi:hypothetical protein
MWTKVKNFVQSHPWRTLGIFLAFVFVVGGIGMGVVDSNIDKPIASRDPKFASVGADGALWLNANGAVCSKENVNPTKKWIEDNPVEPRQHFSYSVVMAALMGYCISPTNQGQALHVMNWLNIASHLLSILVWYKVMVVAKVNNARQFVLFLPAMLISGSIIGPISFINPEPVMVLLSGAVLYCLFTEHWIVAGALMGFIPHLKILWLALPAAFFLVQWIRQGRKALGSTAITFVSMVAVSVTLLVITYSVVGWEYGIGQTQNYVRLMTHALSDMYFAYPPTYANHAFFEDALIQVGLNYFGPYEGTRLLIMGAYALISANWVWMVWWLMRRAEGITDELVLKFVLFTMFTATALFLQVEYADLVVFGYVLLLIGVAFPGRKWTHLLLVYILSAFIQLSGVNIVETPVVLAALIVSIWLLGKSMKSMLNAKLTVSGASQAKYAGIFATR